MTSSNSSIIGLTRLGTEGGAADSMCCAQTAAPEGTSTNVGTHDKFSAAIRAQTYLLVPVSARPTTRRTPLDRPSCVTFNRSQVGGSQAGRSIRPLGTTPTPWDLGGKAAGDSPPYSTKLGPFVAEFSKNVKKRAFKINLGQHLRPVGP